jgi:predicted  nucleic acid-binding Zn-ribbon protein
VDSGKVYVGIVAQERNKFELVLVQQTEATVTAKERELVALDDDIKAKASEIQALTEAINAAQTKKMQLNNELITNRSKIEQVRANFNMTAGVIEAKIQKDLDCIARYIPDLPKGGRS